MAVREALHHIEGEVIVFDNASTDGSKTYLEPRFPDVRFIWNDENLGFGRANNRALVEAKGDIILFLNPDTIIGEYCLLKAAEFLKSRKDAGALGVRMIDGGGRYLKESKRGYPSVWTSFYKLSGLATIFPRSKRFAKYYLGHLDPRKTHEIDVLAGAFMMVKREVLDKTGGFDEQFFMYGEDIDLSYRIQKAGYKNVYYADETIIHFKGESTRRGSLSYIRMFYSAMIIFVGKHYKGWDSRIFMRLLKLAIICRGFIAYLACFNPGNWFSSKNRVKNQTNRSLAVVGQKEDLERIKAMIQSGPNKGHKTGFVHISADDLKNIKKGDQFSPNLKGDLVLCKGSLTNEEIIYLTSLIPAHINVRFHARGSSALVGSDSSKTSGVVIC